jgi:ribosomal protein S18 acetylase RimI-like enzyme
MIRCIVPADTQALVDVSIRSGLFRVDDADAIRSLLIQYHAEKASLGHRMLTLEEGGALQGICYVAPREFADRVWEILMIAVDRLAQRRGVGSALLAAVEHDVQAAGGRLLLIETSSQSGFQPAWSFYRRHGYREVARVPDYYSDGDDKLSFLKRLGRQLETSPPG